MYLYQQVVFCSVFNLHVDMWDPHGPRGPERFDCCSSQNRSVNIPHGRTLKSHPKWISEEYP